MWYRKPVDKKSMTKTVPQYKKFLKVKHFFYGANTMRQKIKQYSTHGKLIFHPLNTNMTCLFNQAL